ncbi:TRAP transporter substrate-binding protein DctP [Aeromicrobium sp. YIM 150415]|uniref:TRAP transporter substrate-binding protein n=1 Tax=Aeromicrobium sp. YIM 150415 TaxID=2803912 RepID=UPI0019635E7E|nr:TRAP transporter substrate-binding protein DctP [Aeromicrobium sp. YIM 150415]MBM9464049.1 TRAP transporter substrate-binding protein DctP [Aeromicrobium sp. YIM 150415]
MGRRCVWLALPAAVALTAACGAGGSDDGTITLSVADWLPPQHVAVIEGTQPWMDRVTELTDGQVTFDYYPSEQLGAAADLLQLTRSGVADIAMINAPYTPELLQLSSVGGLPGLTETACESSWGFYAASRPGSAIYEHEYKEVGLHPLLPQGTPAYELMTTDRPVSHPDDASGLTLAVSGGAISSVAEALGSAPVSMGTPSRYEGLQRGTVNGTLLGMSTVMTYSLEEVIDYSTAGASLGGSVAPYAMSIDTWDSLPADVQDAFTQASEESIERYCQAMDEQTTAGREAMEQAGVTIHDLSDDEKGEFAEATAQTREAWITEELPEEKREYGEKVIEEYLEGAERLGP